MSRDEMWAKGYEPTTRGSDKDPHSDYELVERIKCGEMAAFNTLLLRHQGFCLSTASRIVGEADADDVVQNAFIKALQNINQFRGKSTFRTWLVSIVINEALNFQTREQRMVVCPTGKWVNEIPSREHHVKDLQRRDKIRLAYRLIPARDIEFLLLCDEHGVEWVADMCKSSVEKVRARISYLQRRNAHILARWKKIKKID